MVYHIFASQFDRRRFLAWSTTLSAVTRATSLEHFLGRSQHVWNVRPSRRPKQCQFFTTQPCCLLVVRNNLVHTYVRERSQSFPPRSPHTYTQRSDDYTHSPKEYDCTLRECLRKTFRLGYGPCTKYVVFCTYRDYDEQTAWDYRDSHRVRSGVEYTASSLRQFKAVFVPPPVYDRWLNSFINSSSRNNNSYYYTHTASTLANSWTIVCVYLLNCT